MYCQETVRQRQSKIMDKWKVQIDYIFQFESIRVKSLNAISKILENLQVIHITAHRFL